MINMTQYVPSISVKYAANGCSTKSNELGMRAIQERAYEKHSSFLMVRKAYTP